MRRTLLLALVLFSAAAGCARGPGGNQDVTSFGLIPVEEAQYNSIPVAMVPPTGTLPASVDLSANMPPPGEQGLQGSCVGWSVAYAVRTYIEKRQQNWDAHSPQNQFSPAFIYNQVARGNCGGGMTFVQALNILTSQGAVTMASMPYTDADCSAQPDEETRRQAQYYRVAQYRRLNVQDLFEVKAHLAAGFPVLVSVASDEYFQRLGRDAVWTTKGPTTGFHAVVLVGYDDAAGVFKILNSWGTDWGSGGYGWVSYDLFPRATREAYIVAPFEVQPAPGPEPEPAHTPAPDDYVEPQPEPRPEEFTEGIEIVDVEQGVTHESGLAGMNVTLRYTLVGYAGNGGQILLHFWFPDGRPVPSVVPSFSDIYGNAAVGTPVFRVEDESYVNYEFTTFVPYDALNVPRRRGGARLLVGAGLYINMFGVAQAEPEEFILEP